MSNSKNSFHAKVAIIDLLVKKPAFLLNEYFASEHGVDVSDRMAIVLTDGKEVVANVELTRDYVQPGFVGVTKDLAEKYGLIDGEHIGFHYTERSDLSVSAIRRRLRGQTLTEEDIFAIIKDISDNKLTDTLISYYAASNFVREADDEELYLTAKAMAECGETLSFDGVVADKHCIGGVPGNETTMIIVPTVASLGIKIPKVFSKAITSPAATGECVEILMNNTFTKPEIEDLVKKNNCSLVWGGGLDLAPADDKIIKVSYPLSMQSYDKMISSIMAKQYAMGINHCLIDIPVGPTAKVTDQKTAEELVAKFTYVGEHLGMKIDVAITPAEQPIGRGIGAVLQVREVLRVLQQHESRPEDLESKAMFLASKLVELVGFAKGKEALDLCYKQLRSGAAWKKMQEIIIAQAHVESSTEFFDGPASEVISEDLKLGKLVHEVVATSDGVVESIDMKSLNALSRTLGTPLVAQAGVYLNKKMGDAFKKGDILYTLYANAQHKMDRALKNLNEKDIYEIQKSS